MADPLIPEGSSPLTAPEQSFEALSNPRAAASAMLVSHKRNLEFLAGEAQHRSDDFAAALRHQQEIIQGVLEQNATMEGLTDGQRETVKRLLEQRLASVRNFVEVAAVPDQEALQRTASRMADWCDEMSAAILGIANSSFDM
jgi:hypothetical protein